MRKSTLFIGLDAHAESISVATTHALRDGSSSTACGSGTDPPAAPQSRCRDAPTSLPGLARYGKLSITLIMVSETLC
jgi:hypothetical protein